MAVHVDIATTGLNRCLTGVVERVRREVYRAVGHRAVINDLVQSSKTNDCCDEERSSAKERLHDCLSVVAFPPDVAILNRWSIARQVPILVMWRGMGEGHK